jgi:hypothetical protein
MYSIQNSSAYFLGGQSIHHAHTLVFPSSPLEVLSGVLDCKITLQQLTRETTDKKLDDSAKKISES